MRRLLRIFLNGLTVLSLLLCLACAALWVRGYRLWDYLGWRQSVRPDAPGFYVHLASGRGGMGAQFGRQSFPVAMDWLYGGWHWEAFNPGRIPYADGTGANRLGFAYANEVSPGARGGVLTFPAWLPTASFAALPLTRAAFFIRRRRRKREGHCAKCGYDLRATPDRCPECGHVPPKT